MRRIGYWVLLLVLGAALFAACNNGGKQPQPSQEKGTLVVTVTPSDATVKVLKDGKTVYAQTGSFTKDFDPGTYTVRGEKEGYKPAEQEVKIEAGKRTEVNLTLSEIVTPPEPEPEPVPVASLEVTRYYDEWGYNYAVRKEINPGKDVDLLAAQYEDSVCVDVVAKDAEGKPVPGALVSVGVFGAYEAYVIPGCVKDGTEPSAMSTPEIRTDENGKATFTIFLAPWDSEDEADLNLGPVTEKFVVTATNAGASALKEFKVFFYNIDHLYYDDNLNDESYGTRTPQRWGYDFGTFTNSYKSSEHVFDTVIFQGQPSVPDIDPELLGAIVYTVEGEDAGKVVFTNCDNLRKDGACVDYDGEVGIDLNKSKVGLEDLPVEVKVKAVLSVKVEYGDHTYWFPLKEYTFTKRWIGAFLTIDKVIDHHVVTWMGPEHTLKPTAKVGEPWIATYTITVTNPSQQTATNVTITDALPPELGYVVDSAEPAATYDAVLHELTWVVGDLKPGESVSVSFSVYARQKPGFCWQEGEKPGDFGYYYSARPPQNGSIAGEDGTCENPYSDPYQVLNGRYKDDVTVEADNIDPIDYIPVPEKVVLWVVRPIYDIEKYIKTPGGGLAKTITVLEDDNVDFVFKAENRSRDNEPGYKALIATYPEEFDGTLYANPYGSAVSMDDYFDEGLDYDSSIGGTWKESAPKYVDFGVSKENPLPYKGTAFTDVALSLTAAEPTQEEPWLNCAYLDANNLNQPAEEPLGIDWPNVDDDPKNDVKSQILGDLSNSDWVKLGLTPDLHSIPAATSIAGKLESCVTVYVEPRETEAILTLSTVKEHVSNEPTAAETDPVDGGETYWYFFLVNADEQNSTNVDDIVFEATLTGDAQLTGNYRVMEAEGVPGSQWPSFSWSDVALTATVSGSTITFSEYDGLVAGHYLLYMIEARADVGGTQATIKAEITNSTADNQPNILPVTEQTQIRP